MATTPVDSTTRTLPDLTRGVPEKSIPRDTALAGRVGERVVLLAWSDQDIVAIQGECPHYGALLSEGCVADGRVHCPWHHAAFELRDGSVHRPPALRPLQRWPVERRAGQVRVTHTDPLPAAVPTAPERSGPDKVVVLGAGAAGTAATFALRQHGYEGAIILVDPDPAAPYDRPNLSKDFLAGTAPAEWLPLAGATDWEALGVERIVAAADRLDTSTRTVHLADGGRISYDALVLATGATSRALPVPGNKRSHVHTLRSLDDCLAIRERATLARNAVVVGAGFLGLEVASSLRTLALSVQVIAPEQKPLERVFGTALSSAIQRLNEDHGVTFHLGRTVTEIREDEVCLSDDTCLPADLVIVAVGANPCIGLAQDAGLAVDDGVLVNRYLQSTADSVYAVGDIARFPHPGTRGLLRIEHWAVAQAQGRTAALHILGQDQPFRDIPFFWTQQYDVPIAWSGFPQAWEDVVQSGSFEEGGASYRLRADGADVALATVFRDADSLRWEIQQARRVAAIGDGP